MKSHPQSVPHPEAHLRELEAAALDEATVSVRRAMLSAGPAGSFADAVAEVSALVDAIDACHYGDLANDDTVGAVAFTAKAKLAILGEAHEVITAALRRRILELEAKLGDDAAERRGVA